MHNGGTRKKAYFFIFMIMSSRRDWCRFGFTIMLLDAPGKTYTDNLQWRQLTGDADGDGENKNMEREHLFRGTELFLCPERLYPCHA